MRFLQPAMGIIAMYPLFAQVLCSTNYVSTPVNQWATGDFFYSTIKSDSIVDDEGLYEDLKANLLPDSSRMKDLPKLLFSVTDSFTVDEFGHKLKSITDSLNLKEINLLKSDSIQLFSILKNYYNVEDINKSTESFNELIEILKKIQTGADEFTKDPINIIKGLQQSLVQLNKYTAEKENLICGISDFGNVENVKKEALNNSKSQFIKKSAELLNTASQQFIEMKKEYSRIEDLRYASNSTSNENRRRKTDKFLLGGNFQILKGNPILADISPLMEYAFTEKIHTGLGVSIPIGIDLESPSVSVSKHNGYRLFLDYYFKSLYIHTEVEGRQKDITQNDGSGPKSLTYLFRVGGGKSFRLNQSLNGYVQLNYIVNHNKSIFYSSPLNWQIGIKKKLKQEN